MLKLVRTNSDNADFRQLVIALDKDLLERYADLQAFFSQFNKTHTLQHVIIAYQDHIPAGCGALRAYEENNVEIKRMYVDPVFRGKGIAGSILEELESWAKELNFSACILETGNKQPEAIGLYQKKGYLPIPNYGHYKDVENSICMKKILG